MCEFSGVDVGERQGVVGGETRWERNAPLDKQDAPRSLPPARRRSGQANSPKQSAADNDNRSP